MAEREIFIEALDKGSPAERAAFLDAACAGDAALRGRVEALLRSHEGAGEFLNGSAPERLAGVPGAGVSGDETRTGPSGPDADDNLDFLEPSDKPGSVGRLGHYEVREVVGRGGMGVVLKAFDETLHRVVAIKVMAPQLATSATARKRFTREARAQAAVTHDHVVTIHAVEESGPLPHIVMQFVAGQSLQDRLDRSGPLQLAEVLRIGMQAASGLAAAHAQGLVHRDIKPANILLENGVERVKLTDFGLARAADDASLTASGTVAGTPAFMSPEQAEGKPLDHRSDLFSLGSVLYAMCTGRPPFRAGTNMGVLKRVCEDAPTPVGEANPEVPDWLAEIIKKLHAKDPAERFQSAAEVAEVLGGHLAHVQHPSVVRLPAVVKPAEPTPAPARLPHRRRQWAAAAAVLVATLAVLGTTEATGVTNVRATVIRVFTPEGTLVVETDDPAVKVTVAGDGDLVITGAGPQEVRLKAGSYRLKATRDGKPVKLDRDLVAISRNGREIVRVRLEDETPAAVAPKAESGAFVLLGGKGVLVRKFDTLAEAVKGASDGDTIEIRGNGPFGTKSIDIGFALTIRAAAGSRPVIQMSLEGRESEATLLNTSSLLVLEGLEFQDVGPKRPPGANVLRTVVRSHRDGFVSSLYIANCRFVMRDTLHVRAGGPDSEFRNCEFVGGYGGHSPSSGYAVQYDLHTEGRLVLDNCVQVGGFVDLAYYADNPEKVTVRLTRNTLLADHPFHVSLRQPPKVPAAGRSDKAIEVVASGNVLDGRSGMFYLAHPISEPAAVETLLRRWLGWRGRHNVYPTGVPLLIYDDGPRMLSPTRELADWEKFWATTEVGSLQGGPKYRGGDLRSRAVAAPGSVTPDDFRLRPDSAGYRAGKDGKDLGADVDLVGPGAAYERWKKTPEYQQWLKETVQTKK